MPRKDDPAYKTENSVFATRLREIMKERGENQTTLASKIASQYVTIQRQTISLYMSGQSKPDTERLTAIAKVLDVSSDWLLGMSDFQEPVAEVRQICNYTGLSASSIRQLHYLNSLDGPLKVSLWLLDEILKNQTILNFRTDAWRYAVAGLYDKPSEELADHMSELNKELLKGALNGDKASTVIKIPILGIENLSHVAATDGIKRAAERVLDTYREMFYSAFIDERNQRKE